MRSGGLSDDVDDAETEEVLNSEFSFLGSENEDASHELRMQTDSTDWGKRFHFFLLSTNWFSKFHHLNDCNSSTEDMGLNYWKQERSD